MKFKYVFLGLTLMIGIRNLALATQTARGLSQSPNLIHSCRQVGDRITLGYFNGMGIDGRSYEYPRLCQMRVTGCKKGNELTHPEGSVTTAFCDHGPCNILSREHRNCDCPTNPNDCVNDQVGDGHTNYSNVTRILEERQNRPPPPATVAGASNPDNIPAMTIEGLVNRNKEIFQQLQDGVPCDQVNGVPYGLRVSFHDRVENIFSN